jgi:hypothetical protein
VNNLSIILLLALTASARAQIDTPSVPPEQDQNNIFARAAASRVAIIGTVIKREGKSEQISSAEVVERLHHGKDYRAVLYTINVDEIVCQQQDFSSNAPRFNIGPEPLLLVSPFDESDLPNGEFREELRLQQKYLLLLTDNASAQLAKTFNLDPNRIYYRGEEHLRGIIPLEPEPHPNKTQKQPDIVGEFRELCAAMRPPKLEDKMALLQQLTDSADPVLQREAEEAKKAVRKQMQAAAEDQKQEPHAEPK